MASTSCHTICLWWSLPFFVLFFHFILSCQFCQLSPTILKMKKVPFVFPFCAINRSFLLVMSVLFLVEMWPFCCSWIVSFASSSQTVCLAAIVSHFLTSRWNLLLRFLVQWGTEWSRICFPLYWRERCKWVHNYSTVISWILIASRWLTCCI